jgi:hypothetical protein
MNIFQLSETGCPVEATQMHCDRHMKIILECAQMLCDAFVVKDITAPYKKCNPNHPATKWARQTRQNFDWMIYYGRALSAENTKRYGKIHKSTEVIEWCNANVNLLNLPDDKQTQFVTAIKDDKECRKRIRNFNDLPVWQQYRLYYVFDKPFAKWDRLQNTPQWFLDMKQKYGIVLQ